MSDVVAELQAAADELRVWHRESEGTEHDDPAWDSLATLIDGMLERHQPRDDGPLSLVADTYCSCRRYEVREIFPGEMSLAPALFPCADLLRSRRRPPAGSVPGRTSDQDGAR
jgi:hypothetical protein